MSSDACNKTRLISWTPKARKKKVGVACKILDEIIPPCNITRLMENGSCWHKEPKDMAATMLHTTIFHPEDTPIESFDLYCSYDCRALGLNEASLIVFSQFEFGTVKSLISRIAKDAVSVCCNATDILCGMKLASLVLLGDLKISREKAKPKAQEHIKNESAVLIKSVANVVVEVEDLQPYIQHQEMTALSNSVVINPLNDELRGTIPDSLCNLALDLG